MGVRVSPVPPLKKKNGMAQVNLEKEKWFIEQVRIGRIFFDGTNFVSRKTATVFKVPNSKGYIRISLQCPLTKKIHSIMAHRLIWVLTYGQSEDTSLVLNHIDGNKLNNAISNLELVTHKRNIDHAIATGLINIPKAEDRSNAKFTNSQVREFRRLFDTGQISIDQIAERVGCHPVTVNYMVNRKTYQSVK